jgi:hypothetical protein
MTARPLGARPQQRRAAVWIVALAVGGVASAQSASEPSEYVGFQAGGAVIAPSLTAGYTYNTNINQRPAGQDPQPDGMLTLQPALLLTVPFSNSSFQFGDVLTYFDYSEAIQTEGKTANDAVAELNLNFGSRDSLEISAHNVAGVAQTLFDPGNQVTFQGNSYNLHTEAISFLRVVSGARGYRFALSRTAVRFEPSTTVQFYNFRGFDGGAEYLEPLSPNTRLSFGYLGSRYDHFDADDPTTLLRSEAGDTIFGQVEGQLGPRQPYLVRLGWQRLMFTGPDAAAADDFSGIVGQARLSAIVGGGTMITFQIQRQPYRSFVQPNNYYLYDAISGWVERVFPQGSSVGGLVGFSMNSYNQPTSDPNSSSTYYRQDRRVQLEAYANLALAKHVLFRVTLARNRRSSNAPDAGYIEKILFGGFVFGWS